MMPPPLKTCHNWNIKKVILKLTMMSGIITLSLTSNSMEVLINTSMVDNINMVLNHSGLCVLLISRMNMFLNTLIRGLLLIKEMFINSMDPLVTIEAVSNKLYSRMISLILGKKTLIVNHNMMIIAHNMMTIIILKEPHVNGKMMMTILMTAVHVPQLPLIVILAVHLVLDGFRGSS